MALPSIPPRICRRGREPPLSEGLLTFFTKPSCEGTSIIPQLVVAGPNKTIVASVGIEIGGGDETPSVYVICREHKWTEGNP
jgi:hypothetical protein